MKPTTKIQKKIISLRDKLPNATKRQEKYAYSNAHDCFVHLSYKSKHDCLECGYSWKENHQESRVKCKCPSCKKDLKELKNYKTANSVYFSIITTIENFQVIRIFLSKKSFKKGEKASHELREVIQHYIDEQGNINTITSTTQSFSMYFDSWGYGDLEFRAKSYKSNLIKNICPYLIYPKTKVLPTLKRNGYNNSTHGITPQFLFSELLKNEKIETLFKMGKYKLIDQHIDGEININKYWNQLKIAFKNNYEITDIKLWMDYIKLLEYLDKDIKNAKYVCPINLKKEHDRYMEKKRIAGEKKRIENLKAQIESENKKYQASKKDFFNLMFQKGKLTIEPIKTVEDFLNEAEELKHCLFTNEYWKENDSLILSAKKDGERIETIEFNLKTLKVVQCRGKFNNPTKHNKEIKRLINSNKTQIQKIAYKTAS